MKKLVFLFFLVISITGLSASVEIKMPSFDKKMEYTGSISTVMMIKQK